LHARASHSLDPLWALSRFWLNSFKTIQLVIRHLSPVTGNYYTDFNSQPDVAGNPNRELQFSNFDKMSMGNIKKVLVTLLSVRLRPLLQLSHPRSERYNSVPSLLDERTTPAVSESTFSYFEESEQQTTANSVRLYECPECATGCAYYCICISP
jgi:hypothetical protein